MKNALTASYRIIAIVCTLLVLIARPAHAYLDPGTGSYATQIVLASIVGALFSAKLIFQGIARFFRNLLPKSSDANLSPVEPVAVKTTVAPLTREEATNGASSAE